MPALLTIADFCRLYGISRSTAYRLINNQNINLVKIGRASRIKREDAEAWLASLEPVSLGNAA